MAMAAMVPDWTTVKPDHENRKAQALPMDSRMNTYWPPAFGYAAASSENVRAPHNVKVAPPTQASITSGAFPTKSNIRAGVKKIPEPMIDPTMRPVTLQNPSSGLNV